LAFSFPEISNVYYTTIFHLFYFFNNAFYLVLNRKFVVKIAFYTTILYPSVGKIVVYTTIFQPQTTYKKRKFGLVKDSSLFSIMKFFCTLIKKKEGRR
jgi:hypothetical protein